MVIYLGLHFLIFSRPKSTARYHRSGVAFGAVLVIEIIIALVQMISASGSICSDGQFGSMATFTSVLIMVINLVTIVGAVIFFLLKTADKTAQVASVEDEGRNSLVNNDVSKSERAKEQEPEQPAEPKKQEKEEEEEPYKPEVGGGDDEMY